MTEPSYHFTTDRATGRHVFFVRHALPPHDIVGGVEFADTAKIREAGTAMLEWADAIDAVARIPRPKG